MPRINPQRNPKRVRIAPLKERQLYTHTPIIDDDVIEVTSIQTEKKEDKTDVLDAFCLDLNKEVENELLEIGVEKKITVGRAEELDILAKYLFKRDKKNIIIVGESGTGRRNLLKGFINKAKNSEVPFELEEVKIKELNLDLLVSGIKYKGSIEERIKAINYELSSNEKVIIFIKDAFHVLLRENNLYNLVLDKLIAKFILTITPEELNELFKHDLQLKKKVNILKLKPLNNEEAIKILELKKQTFESLFSCSINTDIINEIVELASIYFSDSSQPSKSFEVIEEIGTLKSFQRMLDPKDQTYQVYEEIKEVKSQITESRILKLNSIKKQNFEQAAVYRDQEKILIDKENEIKLSLKKKKSNIKIEKEDVYLAISNLTGIPIDKILLKELIPIKVFSDYLSTGIPQYEKLQALSILHDTKIKISEGHGFVLLPHTEEYENLFKGIIKPALEENGLIALKANDIKEPGTILSQVWREIRTSQIIIADVSEQNPNVIFELGLCLGIQRCPIILTRDPEKLPFNLRSLRYLQYNNSAAGGDRLKKELSIFIKEFLSAVQKEVY